MVHAVNQPADPNPRHDSRQTGRAGSAKDFFYTPDQADRALPLVRQIAGDLIRLRAGIDAQTRQVGGLHDLHTASLTDHGTFAEELADIHDSLAADKIRFDDHVRELAQLGVVMHESVDGHFDFRAKLDRRTVHLCWHFGEPAVTHWHEVGEEAAKRRREINEQAFADSVN